MFGSIGAPIQEQIGGENFIRHIGSDKLILDFHEGSGTIVHDKSHCGNNGTFGAGSAAPTWKRNELYFDGADYVEVADNANIRFGSDNFTIIVHTIDKLTGSSNGAFISKGTFNVSGEWVIYDYSGDCRMRADIISALLALPAMRDGMYHAIVFTRRGSLGTIYFDSFPITTDTTSSINLNTTKKITIGARDEAAGVFLTGYIKQIYLIKKALSQVEIQQNYLVNKFKN